MKISDKDAWRKCVRQEPVNRQKIYGTDECDDRVPTDIQKLVFREVSVMLIETKTYRSNLFKEF